MPETLLKCYACGETFKESEAILAEVSNILTAPLKDVLPKCPHCKVGSIIGFQEVKEVESGRLHEK